MVGESIGSYRITAKLGEGGMGAVYLGEHRRIARKAAIKVLLPELSANQQIVERFFNEARATSLIRHPGIVEIADCDVLPSGSAYIVMELLEGESLGSFLRRGERLSVARALFLTRHIADALAAAHDQRIVHRDLKPDNIFLLAAAGAPGGGAPQPIKIVDFGIAKLMFTDPGERGHQRTRTGSIMGTPIYMSPEQCRGAGEVDHRTDVYSLGCMLFEMLCGRPPFTHEGFGELIGAHLATTPPTARSLVPSLPPAVDALVARTLAKSPDDRPQTMRALIAELDAAGAGAAAVTPAPDAPRAAAGAMDIPKLQTTLRSASAEKLSIATAGDDGGAIGKPRGARSVAIAALALAAAGGGLWYWRAGAGGAATPIAEVALLPVAPAPAPAPPSPSPSPPAAPSPPPPSQSPPPSPPSPATTTKPPPAPVAPASRGVRLVIASNPPGAEVCLESDRVVLGKTRFEWRPDKGSGAVKFLIRKRGYRGQEITVAPEHYGKRMVTLDKLGPDDIDDVDNCTPK